MLERSAYLRPIAHRGLHDPEAGVIENTAPAFAAAVARGYGVECDLRPAACGTPIVFHDPTLERLVDARGELSSLALPAIKRLTYRGQSTSLLLFAELLELVAGQVPMLVEIKSDWTPVDPRFLRKVADLALRYTGPLAVMSFDPAATEALRKLAPKIPRGIVAGSPETAGVWPGALATERTYSLGNLLESGPSAPSFYAYDVRALPTPVTRFTREVLGLPLFAWTVRTEEDRARASAWADAMIFEACEP